MTTASTTAPALLISGATGTIGTELTKLLAAQGVSFRAMVRDPKEPAAQALAALPGASLVTADFNQPNTVAAALAGIERAFLLTNSTAQAEAQQLSFVELARQAGVQHVVKQSQWAARTDSPVRFLRYHAAVEEALRASGMAYTFLRPNLFMQGLLAFKQSMQAHGKFFAAIGEAPISAVDVRDIAAAAAATLTQPGHGAQTYDLTGPEALSHSQMALRLTVALGYPVTFVSVAPADMLGTLLGMGMDAWQAEGLIEDYAHYDRGEAATVASGVREATGREPRPFAAFAQDYAAQFGSKPK